MMHIKLTPQEIIDLKRLHRQCREDQRKADRIKAILLLNDGYDEKEVAKILLLDQDTITNYKKRFLNRTSIQSWLEDNQIYYEGKLSDVQALSVKKFVRGNIITASKIVKRFISDKFGIKYSTSGVVSLLHRLNFVNKYTKNRPSKYNEKAQADFKKMYEKLESKLTEKEVILFMDATHPQYNTQPTRVWVERGKEKIVKTNTGRSRININGVYNPHNQDAIVREEKSVNSESTIELFKDIENAYPEKENIYVIADNSTYYRKASTSEYLKTSKIKLIFLPTYSPNLNLIERLWNLMLKDIIKTNYYDCYKDFKEAVMGFFDNIKQYKEKVRQFVGIKLHLFQAA